jgi:O-acetyl-ADP-ribose deacetylase (regulator of RNase III)
MNLQKGALEWARTFTKQEIPLGVGVNYTHYVRELKSFGVLYKLVNKVLVINGPASAVAKAKLYVEQSNSGMQPTSESIHSSEFPNGEYLLRYLIQGTSQKMAFRLLEAIEVELTKSCGNRNLMTVSLAIDDSDSDEGDLLVLHGPRDLMEASRACAVHHIREIAAVLCMHRIEDMKEDDISWLKVNSSGVSNFGAVVDFTSPRLDLDHLSSDRCRCTIGLTEVVVACCSFEATGLEYDCDTLVNSANSKLMHQGGIARAISLAAGSEMSEEGFKILRKQQQVATGSAVITEAYRLCNLGFSNVVHTVAPTMTKSVPGSAGRLRRKLQEAIVSALDLANGSGAKRVAIPGVGMGLFGWSCEVATREIVAAISKWLAGHPDHGLDCIVLFDQDKEVVNSFVDALELLSSGLLRTEPEEEDAKCLVADTFEVPSHQWFWTVWEHEISSKPAGCTSVVQDETGASFTVIPYDYDQCLQIEGAFSRGAESCQLFGDIQGARNGHNYNLDLLLMTQTTVPYNNTYSCRKIFRRPVVCVDDIPLFTVRKEAFEKCSNTKMDVDVDVGVGGLQLGDQKVTYSAEALRGIGQGLEGEGVMAVVMQPRQDGQRNATFQKKAITLFGERDEVEQAEQALRAHLEASLLTEPLCLQDLRHHASIPFASVFDELSEHLRKCLHASVAVKDEAIWEIELRALGREGILKAKLEVSNFEKRKISEKNMIPLPETWGYDNLSNEEARGQAPELEVLEEDDAELPLVRACFFERGFQADIISIERVKNVELYRLYHKKRAEVAELNNGSACELLLKHGTRTTEPHRIWDSGPSRTNSYGFDFRYSSNQNFFGQGAYFTDDGAYTRKYAYKGLGDGVSQVFLAYVAAGSMEQKQTSDIRKGNLCHPGKDYQSIRGPIEGATQGVIVYELNQSYPAFLVTYRK